MNYTEDSIGIVYTFTVRHENGDAFNLTGYTVTLLIGTQTARACSLTDAAGGVCTYTSVAGDNTGDAELKAANSPYKARLHLVKSTTNDYTTRPIDLEVVTQ